MAKKKSKEEKYLDLDKIIEEKAKTLIDVLGIRLNKATKYEAIRKCLTEVMESTEENNRRRNRNMVRYLNE